MTNSSDNEIDSLINSIGSGYEKKFKNLKFKLSNTTLFSIPSNVNNENTPLNNANLFNTVFDIDNENKDENSNNINSLGKGIMII